MTAAPQGLQPRLLLMEIYMLIRTSEVESQMFQVAHVPQLQGWDSGG